MIDTSSSRRRGRRRRRSYLPLLLFAVALIATAALRAGGLPVRLLPLPALDLAQPSPWFLDTRLAALKNNAVQCAKLLAPPHVLAAHLSDNPYRAGCGWQTAVRLSAAGGAKIDAEAVTCEVAAALALWIEHDVQTAAVQHFGSRVASVQTLGSYACRNIVGSKLWKDFRSQHATANAIDISGFTLADGRTVSVRRDWTGSSEAASFLHDIHARACRRFRVALSPDYNPAHHDHLHLDRGFIHACR